MMDNSFPVAFNYNRLEKWEIFELECLFGLSGRFWGQLFCVGSKSSLLFTLVFHSLEFVLKPGQSQVLCQCRMHIELSGLFESYPMMFNTFKENILLSQYH